MTVSRALRGSAEISERTRIKIREIADSLGYMPNRIAGALSSQSVNLVGVVVPSLSSMVFPEVLRGISAALKDSPLQPVVGVTGYDLEEEERVIREMLSWRPSGLIVAGLEHSEAAKKLMAQADHPVVEVMDVDGEPVEYSIGISHIDAGRQMAKAILSAGYRRVGFIGTKINYDFRAQKRLHGFKEELVRAGIELSAQELYAKGSSLAKGKELTSALLQQNPTLECIYYSSDIMAAGGLMHCMSLGLKVPDDLGIAGHNRLDILEGLPLELATTDAYRYEIGFKAGALLRDATEGLPVEKQYRFPTTVLKGASLVKP